MLKLKLPATLASGFALALGVGSVPAHADLVFTGSGTSTDGSSIAAFVDFGFNPVTNTLTVVLINTGAPLDGPPASQASVLTELLFNGTPNTATALPSASGSAALTAGSSLVGPPDGTTVGQNWQYTAGTGVGTTGIDFGGNGNLCGTAGCGVPVDGSGFGLVPDLSTLTGDGLPTREYIEDSATFTFVFPAGFTLSDITTVSFVYGTGAGDETNLPGIPSGPPFVPEPASLALLGTALASFGLLYRRRKSS